MNARAASGFGAGPLSYVPAIGDAGPPALLLQDFAYSYRVWITLIKLSYTPLQGDLSGPDIHLPE